MNEKRKKWILPVMLTALFLLTAAAPVFAVENTVIDWSKTGSISVALKDSSGTVLSGVKIAVYKVADARSRDRQLTYAFTKDFKNSGVPTDKLADESAVQRLAAYAESRDLQKAAVKTTADGLVKFNDLSLGAYLIMAEGGEDGDVECTPLVAFVPYSTSDRWIYDVSTAPKADIVHTGSITVKKVWNDDGKDRPESVTVQLLKGGAVRETVSLNQQNNWSCQWQDLPKSDAWSVKEIDIPEGYTATYKSDGSIYTITNSAKLPQTGQLNWPIPVMAIAGVLLFALGWTIVFLKEGKRHG